MVADYYFDKSGQDLELLEKMSNIAAAAHAPLMSAAAPELFNLSSFTELDQPRDLGKVFDTTEYAKWKAFRASEDSRYVALTAPRILMREPYGSSTVPIDAFNYEERVDGTNHDAYLWGNSAYALAANVNKAFATYGWCATIRGVESGGLVEGLPVHNFRTDAGELVMKCPTEVQITDRREKELADLGFAALVHQKGTANAAFFSVQSCQKPKVYDTPQASGSARLSAQLPYIFATSRFAHYLKVMMRDKIGGYTSRTEIDVFLNRWIQGYVTGEDAGPTIKAQRPLAEARIDVVEVPGKPGVYRAVAFMRPHFQLDELGVAMRLVAELPQPAA
jgi:type VI secretion system protein ImpC